YIEKFPDIGKMVNYLLDEDVKYCILILR
ncbi:MAG: hypothetical protein QG641_3015, partial [Candidatus Poribacteria bacterium]|nr:hypothetical protein [Candidatus Poribacteria bacterium]